MRREREPGAKDGAAAFSHRPSRSSLPTTAYLLHIHFLLHQIPSAHASCCRRQEEVRDCLMRCLRAIFAILTLPPKRAICRDTRAHEPEDEPPAKRAAFCRYAIVRHVDAACARCVCACVYERERRAHICDFGERGRGYSAASAERALAAKLGRTFALPSASFHVSHWPGLLHYRSSPPLPTIRLPSTFSNEGRGDAARKRQKSRNRER